MHLRQEPNAGRRRWFESDGFELVVWYGERDTITGFQICYDFGNGEHAITWRAESGFAHDVVDTGETTPLRNETPVLTPARSAPWLDLLRWFDVRSAGLEPRLRDFVRQKLAAPSS